MKSINLKSLIDIYIDNNREIPIEYIYFIGSEYALDIKKNELDALEQLINNIEKHDDTREMNKYNYFYLGYKIPQIGKEFDLLRFDDNNILNLEYKRQLKDIEKLKKQLIRNEYYLKFLNKELILIGYIQNVNKLYMLKDKNLEEIDYKELINILNNNSTCVEVDLNKVFKTANYLISPFNKTEQFIENQYFLTDQQEKIKNKIINNLKHVEENFLIQGDAGTGKTLLIYDIAKELMNNNMKVAIIHCGKLNKGHMELREKYSWRIYSIRDYEIVLNNEYNVLFIDEVQRVKKTQFEEIMTYAKNNKIILICSGDRKQILKINEGEILDILEQHTLNKYSLSKKIRTNKELSDFIKVMLDLDKIEDKDVKFDNINITYFKNYIEANRYISSKKDFSFIAYTPTVYPNNGLVGFEITCENENTVGNSHEVIGQEFENVGVIIDKHFYYDNNKLKAKAMFNNVYPPSKMFYQAITRVIETLEIIVVENIDIFNQLVSIANKKI